MKLLSEETDQGLIDKWKLVLDFEGEYVPTIDESDRLRVAKAMNDMEKYIDTQIPFESRSILARVLIPLIRRTLKDFNSSDIWRKYIKATLPLGRKVEGMVSFWIIRISKEDYMWFRDRFDYHPSLKPILNDDVDIHIALDSRFWGKGDVTIPNRGWGREFGAYSVSEIEKITCERDSMEYREYLLQKWGPMLSSLPDKSSKTMLIEPQEQMVDKSSE